MKLVYKQGFFYLAVVTSFSGRENFKMISFFIYILFPLCCLHLGGKVILAGTLMESGICLLHTSCDGDSLELSIKSNNRLLNDAVLKHCVTVFR